MDRKTLYIVSAICVLVIIISGYLALSSTSREPDGFGRMMGPWMMQNFGSQNTIIYVGLLIAAVIALGVVLIIYRMERTIAVKAKEEAASPPEAQELEPEVEAESPIEILPEDEQAVMAPVLKDPGLTQGEVVALSKYSKAKVSQVLSELENRGLIYREKQGKTFRVYPGKKMEK